MINSEQLPKSNHNRRINLFRKKKSPKILEIWIFNNSGLLLVNVKNSRCIERQTVDPLLFSGILAAIECLSGESLNHIAMNDSQLTILPISEPHEMFLVALTTNKMKIEKVRTVLVEIYQAFWAEFKEIVPTWSGNLSIFEYFKDFIEKEYFCLD